MSNDQIVKFYQDNMEIDVNVSPKEKTVWLTKEQISILFERDRSVISKHIHNIYQEGELDKDTSCAKNAHKINGQIHYIEYYNLDVVISVGYRVKSKNGIIFRKWANQILNEYLIKGYVIDNNRTLVTNENYINLIRKVDSIDNRLNILERNDKEKEKIFFDGSVFDAKVFISEIISKANKNIILIDNYADIKALDYLKYKEEGVSITLYHSSKAKISTYDIQNFNIQYGNLKSIVKENYHDRFIIIDELELFHLGASLNYAGNKTFAITKIDNNKILNLILEDLNNG